MFVTGNLHVATSGKSPGTPRSLQATCHCLCHKNEKNNVLILTPSGLICAQGWVTVTARQERLRLMSCSSLLHWADSFKADDTKTFQRNVDVDHCLYSWDWQEAVVAHTKTWNNVDWTLSNPSYITRWSVANGFSLWLSSIPEQGTIRSICLQQCI